jgi:CheY-like chemotaxis protein
MKRCLVVDDVQVSQFALKQLLSEFQWKVSAVNSTAEAIDALKRDSFDVLVADWHLRQDSGLELIRVAKKESGGRIVAIVISGIEGAERASVAREAGADGFVAKPASRDSLRQCLTSLRLI